MRNSACRALILLAVLLTALPALAQNQVTFRQDEITIETQDGARHRFTVEVAETPPQLAQGLMYRRALAADAGMLFVFPYDRAASMWMKNTFIPLDMLFLASDGEVRKIVQRTVPHSTASITSSGLVRGILEINAGTVQRLGLNVGDRVVHPAFQPSTD
jgi:uncharacterized membrane protein (UPF0127 family)